MREPPKLKIARKKEKVKSTPHLVLTYLQEISDAQGYFELNADAIAQHLGLSRRTVYLTLDALQRQGLVEPVELRRGRGRHSLYRLKIKQKNKPRQIDEKTVNKKCAIFEKRKIKNIKHTLKTVTRQGGGQPLRGRGSQREPTDYQGFEATRVTLVLGARLYRKAMEQIRLGLEGWELPEPIRHALEGFIGLRIDGSSLDTARRLVRQIWALRREIEALARSGAPPRRVCAFVASRLARGKPDRAKREVLRRTGDLLRESLDLELINRRIAGLKRFETERELEFKSGRPCGRCFYQHSRIEYETGRKADGSLNCLGWARLRREELHEALKIAERLQRERHCRSCGGSLRWGQVEGCCWSCWESLLKAPQLPSSPLGVYPNTLQGSRR